MINQLVLMCVCFCVSLCACARIGVCCACVLVSLTLWLRDKSLLERPSWFDGQREGWLTPWPFCVWRRSSLSGAPVSGLMSDGCSGHVGPWLSDRAGWPPSALTLTPLYGHRLNTSSTRVPPSSTAPPSQRGEAEDLSSGLYSCTSLGWSDAPPKHRQTHKWHIILF